MLYECLAGAPPFHRQTEAETLWAHMQDEPAPLPGRPKLDPVLRKGLAKQREERYGTCAELIEAAAEGLGLGAARAVGRRFSPAVLVRRGRVVLGAGLLLLAGTIIAVIVALATSDGSRLEPIGNGVAAIDAADAELASFTEAQTAPSNIAVGEGAVWVLNTEDETVSRIDPRTKQVTKTFETGGRPTTLAAGAGALWVGNGGGPDFNATASISRIDPDTTKTTRTVRLSSQGGWPSAGVPEIAVGAGAVWAVNSTDAVFRIDSETGRLVERIDATGTGTIAAGDEGVWFGGWDNAVRRIDPRTNRVTGKIPVGSHLLYGIAVGAGSIWATSDEGSLWRIDPGRRPIMRTIDVGPGATYVAFGDGAVWTASYVDGKVSKIDPATNAVTASVPVGASQALAAGAGSAWASVAGRPPGGALPASACDGVVSGGSKPDVLIASDLALQGPFGADPRGMADAIRYVLQDHGFRAGRYVVGYQSCDDSTAQAGQFEQRKCAANAHAYAHAERLVAVIGPDRSFCAQVELPILDGAQGGPLAMVGPSTSFQSLTRGGRFVLPPPYGRSGEPDVYYPTGERNFFRVIARDDLQGVAFALLARRLGLKDVYLIHDAAEGYGKAVWADPFRRAASRLGVGIAGSASHAADGNDRAVADRVARSGADGVLVGTVQDGGLLKALRARMSPRATIMAGDGFAEIPAVLEEAGGAARGLYVSSTGLLPDALDLTPAGERFTRDLGETAHGQYALQAAQAMEVVLQAIAHSDGTRASVLRELRATNVRDGLLGSFHFDRYGDMTPAKVTILRVTGRTPPDLTLPRLNQGAVVDRTVTVPASLAR